MPLTWHTRHTWGADHSDARQGLDTVFIAPSERMSQNTLPFREGGEGQYNTQIFFTNAVPLK